MRLDYDLTEKDFLEAQRRHAAFGPALCNCGAYFSLRLPSSLLSPIHTTIRSLFCRFYSGFFLLFGTRLLTRRSFRETRGFNNTFTVISETGIDSSSPTGSTQSTWSAYTRYVESRNLFLLYRAPHVFSLLPKRAFAPGEEESFRGLLNAKLGAATAAHRRKIARRHRCSWRWSG